MAHKENQKAFVATKTLCKFRNAHGILSRDFFREKICHSIIIYCNHLIYKNITG